GRILEDAAGARQLERLRLALAVEELAGAIPQLSRRSLLELELGPEHRETAKLPRSVRPRDVLAARADDVSRRELEKAELAHERAETVARRAARVHDDRAADGRGDADERLGAFEP